MFSALPAGVPQKYDKIPDALKTERLDWGMVQWQHSRLWICLFWFESGCPS